MKSEGLDVAENGGEVMKKILGSLFLAIVVIVILLGINKDLPFIVVWGSGMLTFWGCLLLTEARVELFKKSEEK